MDSETVSPRWLLIEGLKIALILLIGFVLGRIGVDLLTAFPVFPPIVWELFSDIVRYATVLTAVLYVVMRATLQAYMLTKT